MKCIECGHELKDGAIFCIRCGAMQVSMDGKPIERSQDWPTVEAQAGGSGYRSSTDGALHSAQSKNPRGFTEPPKRNGGRIAIIIIVLLVVIAAVAFGLTQCMGQTTSGAGSTSSSASSTSTSSESASTSSASSTSSTSSASSASDSASSASASASSASASDASASASAASGASQTDQTTTQSTTTTTAPEPEPEPEPAPAPAAENDYYVLSDTSSRYYSYDELSGMSTYDLYLARNEIYARHGRMFNRGDLQSYFNSQAWYNPIYSPSEFDSMASPLSDVELQNAKLMKQVEADKGSSYL